MNKTKLMGMTALAAAIVVSPAKGQQQQMVEVSLTEIKDVIARNINVDISKIPLMVQVSTEVAARVCGDGKDLLKPEANKVIPSCPAKSTSAELDQLVKRQIADNEQK